jgi:hypothetical protein
VLDFLHVHIAGADRSDKSAAAPIAKRKGDEKPSPFRAFADCQESLFLEVASQGRMDGQIVRDEERLDLFLAHTMLSAFRPVAIVPLELTDHDTHSLSNVYTINFSIKGHAPIAE